MSIAKAFVPTSMPDEEIWFGDVESFSASEIVITDGFRTAIYGGDFTFGAFGEVSGTLFAVEEYRGDELIYEVAEINLDAAPIDAAIQRGDSQGAAALVFDGNDLLMGSDGPDYLRSYANQDVLNGGGGDDTLEGGPGNDNLTGGSGFDTYVFSGEWGRDVVFDNDLGGQLRFDGYTSDELSFSADVDDRIISVGSNEVRLNKYFFNPAGWDIISGDDIPVDPPSGAWSIEPVGDFTPGDIRIDEAAGSIVLNLTRSNADGTDSVYVSTVQNLGDTNNGDYTGLFNQRVAFAPGENRKTVSVAINDDNVDAEGDEHFGVIVQRNETDPIDVSLAALTFTIVDNDMPVGSAPVVNGAPSADLAPAGTADGITRVTGEVLVDVDDADGDLSFIRFYDTTPGTDGGTLTLDGVPISGAFVDVGPAGLDLVAYEAGPNAGVNEITVEAFDAEGNDSDDLTITINVLAPDVPADIGRAAAGVVYLSSSTGALSSWNPDNDAVVRIGDTGVGLTDLAISPEGALYGISQTVLYKIDADTAEAFRVGPLAGELFSGVDALTDAQGFDIGPDGVGRISSGNNAVVAVVDLETGAVSNPFGASLNQGATSSGDLWFAEEGRYFVTTNSATLLTIAPATFGEGIGDNDFISNNEIEGVVSLAAPSGDQRADLIGFSGNAYFSLAEGAPPALPGLEQGTLAVAGSITGAARMMPTVTSEPPTVTPSAGAFAPNTSIPLDGNTDPNGLFTWSDSDGLADVVEFSVADQSVGGGYLTLDGNPVAQAEGTTITNIPMSEIGRWAFVSGADSEFDNIGFAVTDSSGNTSDATVAFVESDDAPLESEPAEVPQHLLEYFAKEAAYSGGLPASSFLEGSFLNGWTVQHVFAPSGFLAPHTFAAVTLKHDTFGEVLAIRGSSGSKIGDDWFQNFRPGGIALDEFNAALDQLDTSRTVTLRQWLQTTENIAITGHSQGGAQAQYAAIEAIEAGNSPRQISTFNSAGIPLSELDRVPFSDFDDIDVRHFVSHGDIVSLTGNTLIPAQGSGFVYYDFKISAAPSIGELFGRTHQNHWISGELYGLVTPELRMGASDYPAAAVSAVVGGPSLADFLDPDFSLLSTIGDADTEFSDALGRALSFLRETWDFVPEALATLQDSRIALPDLLPAVGPLGSLSSASRELESATNLAGATGNTIADTIESIFDSRATLEGLRDTVGFSLVGTLNALFDFWEFGVALHETLKSIGVATSNALVAGTKAFLSTTISIGDFLLDTIASLPENTVGAYNALTSFLDDLGGLSMVTGPIVAVDSPSIRMDLYGFEGAVVLMREPGASVDLAGGKNILIGSLRSLDDGTVREFGIDDAVFVVGEAIANDELARRIGSAILSYDKDGDGEDDFSISLSGGFRLESFETEIVENGTYIRYLGNGAPEATSDVFATSEASSFTTGNVLENDRDEDGDELSIADLDTTATLGVVTDNGDGTFDYDPNGAFDALAGGDTATDTFAYSVTDGVETVRGEVTITITGSNQAPVASDDSYTIDDGEVLTVAAATLLDGDTDADDDTLTVTGVSNAVNGTVSLDDKDDSDPANDAVIFTPTPDFSGAASFEYTVTDGFGGTDTATVTVSVGETDASGEEPAETPLYQISGNITDPSGRPVSSVSLAFPGSDPVPINQDGSFVLVANAGTNGRVTAVSTDTESLSAPDGAAILRAAMGLSAPDAFELIAADVDQDGAVTAADAQAVFRSVAGLEAQGEMGRYVLVDRNDDYSAARLGDTGYSGGVDIPAVEEDMNLSLMALRLGHMDQFDFA